jgi:hypothetical protein
MGGRMGPIENEGGARGGGGAGWSGGEGEVAIQWITSCREELWVEPSVAVYRSWGCQPD